MKRFRSSRFFKMTVLGTQKFQDPYYQGFAAQMAFFYMLSIVPIIIVLSQLLNIFDLSLKIVQDLLDKYAVGVLGDSITEWFEGSGMVTTNIILVLLALWAGSRANFAMSRITTYTMTSGRSTGRGYVHDRARSLLTITITIVALVFALIAMVFGEKIFYVAVDVLKVFPNIDEEMDNLFNILRLATAFVLYLIMVILNYYIMPSFRPKVKSIMPGGIFAAAGLMIVTWIYSKYTEFVFSAGNYNILYGSLASIVALMFWFYFITWVLVLGVIFNKVWHETGPNGFDDKV